MKKKVYVGWSFLGGLLYVSLLLRQCYLELFSWFFKQHLYKTILNPLGKIWGWRSGRGSESEERKEERSVEGKKRVY